MSEPRSGRCRWATSELDVRYHDEEWGVPLHDDGKLFELLILEGAQAGLSWSTILKRREGYREAFDDFDPVKVARYDAARRRRLLADPRIVRNRAKIDAAVANAGAFLDVQREHGSFDAYLWRFVHGAPVQGLVTSRRPPPTETETSRALSRDLKRRGFAFVGPTICYAFMQAAGLVNDHARECFRRAELARPARGGKSVQKRRRPARRPRRASDVPAAAQSAPAYPSAPERVAAATAAFPVVGVGASAGGLEAFVLPPRGMAWELARIGRHSYLPDPTAGAGEIERTAEREELPSANEELQSTPIDVHVMKTALEHVATAQKYAESIVDTVRSPLVILDGDFRVRSANRAFYETFQVAPGPTLNRVIFDLGNGQWDIPGLRRVLGQVVAAGASFEDFEVEHEFPAIGTRIMLLNARRMPQGEPDRTILLAIEDITARRQAERDVRASEEIRYRRLFETAKDGIVLLDADTGQITNANPFWLTVTGREAGAILGQRLWEIGAFEDPDKIQSILRELETRDFVRDEDLRLVRPDGVHRHVELACNVYRLAGKKVVQCFVRDITERVESLQRERAGREEAEAANRAKDDFLSVLSHELRTPLTAMLGWVRVLRRGALDPSKTADALETVERNTRLLAQLIEDLLDVSRIAAGKLTIEVKPVNLAAIVGAAVETARESVEGKGLALHVEVPEAPPIVSGDRHRLQQVVWNLLSNAVKFTPRDGRIEVRLERLPSGARLTVSDTGRGIAPEFLPQIFDRFRQIESVATRTQGGLGLGLAIVRHLVELHGGRVGVSSAGEGLGTTFTVDLPG